MHAAVFVDFENLFRSLQGREDLTGVRIRDLGLLILENLKARLQNEKCPMVLGRSYAAFDTWPGLEVAHDLALMGLDPQYVLVGHSGKNSADVQLAVDVSRVLFRRPDIDVIVIVSGDRDFIPVARQVLEENRELRVVGIPDTTSGDLRMRVGTERFWNALDLVPPNARAQVSRVDGHGARGAAKANGNGNGPGSAAAAPAAAANAVPNGVAAEPLMPAPNPLPPAETAEQQARAAKGAQVVGHIPVTWRTEDAAADSLITERLEHCLDLMVRAQIRHGSREIWLSPFLKGPMSQHFSSLVHPERRALINELRNRGVIRVEERENMFADHPYSVIVLDEQHSMAQAALARVNRP